MAKIPFGDVDLTKVEIAPIIEAGVYEVKCVKHEIKETKNGIPRLSVQLATTTPAKNTKGNIVPAGVLLYDGVLLAPTGGWTEDMTARQLKSMALCFAGDCPAEFDTDLIDQRVGQVAVKIQDSDRGEQNVIARYIPRGSK